MVVAADYNDKTIFNKITVLNSLSHTIIDKDYEIINLKLFLLPEFKERKVSLSISPATKAISLPKKLYLNNDPVTLSIKIDGRLMPAKWLGELNLASDIFSKKIPLYFEKSSLLH